MPMEAKISLFNEFLSSRGMKITRQRELIAREFFSSRSHISAEELYRTVSQRDQGIGLVTVYRTLKLLSAAGLARERQFGDHLARYDREEPHDHLICTKCGRIIEFRDEGLPRIHARIAARWGFTSKDHRLEVYGTCRECRVGADLSGVQKEGRQRVLY